MGFIREFKKIRINAVRGPLYIDSHGNVVQNSYIRKIARVPGDRLGLGVKPNSLWNIVVKTYPAVSQFYLQSPEEFLKQPVYSKTYPGCKFCK